MTKASIIIATFGDRATWDAIAAPALASALRQTVPCQVVRHHIDEADPTLCSRARNEAMALATSEWALVLDADDSISDDCIEHLLAAEGDIRVPAIACQRPDGTWSEVRPLKARRTQLDGVWPVIGSLIRVSDFMRLGGFRPRVWGEDSEYWLRCELSGLKFGQSEKAVYRIGYRENSRKTFVHRNGLWLKIKQEALEEFKACRTGT